MKSKFCICSHHNYLTFRTAIEAEILFAVCVIKKQALTGGKILACEDKCSKKIGAESAVFNFVFFVMLKNKIEQSAAQRCLNKKLSLSKIPTDRTFENRRSRYKELGKKVPQAYRVYVEDTFLPCDAGDARIFSKEETGLYYYGARYLDPKYSRWLSGEPALGEYVPKAPIDDEVKKHNENLPGMVGVFNVVNLHVYHYAGNNPVKYVDPTGMWINNEDGTYTAEKEDTLYGLYGDDWKEKSGFTRDPRTLQVGEIVEKKIILENKKAAITYNDDGIDPNGYTEIFTTKFDWVIKPHGKINLAEADIFYKHRNGVSPNTIVAITGIKIKNIRNFYDRKGRYISSEINYEEIFLLPGEASSK